MDRIQRVNIHPRRIAFIENIRKTHQSDIYQFEKSQKWGNIARKYGSLADSHLCSWCKVYDHWLFSSHRLAHLSNHAYATGRILVDCTKNRNNRRLISILCSISCFSQLPFHWVDRKWKYHTSLLTYIIERLKVIRRVQNKNYIEIRRSVWETNISEYFSGQLQAKLENQFIYTENPSRQICFPSCRKHIIKHKYSFALIS